MKLGRNDPCHCGSGKKYKACHLAADEAAARKKLSEANATAAPEAAPAEASSTSASSRHTPRHQTQQPWKGGKASTRGFARVSATRKVGGGG